MENENIDSLIEDLSELGYPGIEIDINYGIGKKEAFEIKDNEIAKDFFILDSEKIRRIRGYAFRSNLELDIVTSKEKKIKFKIIEESYNPIALHIEFNYSIKKEIKKYSLLNNSNSIAIGIYFEKYMQNMISPVELLLACINLTKLASSEEESDYIVIGNPQDPLGLRVNKKGEVSTEEYLDNNWYTKWQKAGGITHVGASGITHVGGTGCGWDTGTVKPWVSINPFA